MRASVTPAGMGNSCASLYCGSATARFMNAAQIGAAARAPSILMSELSSLPTQMMQIRLLVKPANQASCEVPVLPAAGAEKPSCRVTKPVPEFMTTSIMLVVRYATRGSSTGCICAEKSCSGSPLAVRIEASIQGLIATPAFANTV